MLEFRLPALTCSLNLILGFLVFSLIGYAIMALMGGRWLQRLKPIPVIWFFVVGQTGITTLYYFRSLLSHVARKYVGVSIPISAVELWSWAVAFGVLGAIFACREYRSLPRRSKLRSFTSLIIQAFTLWLVLLGISLMELPREIMLSSDPDLHAFWASQIGRIGEVPWSQGLWGPDRFGYPAGFAVLNYTWSVFSSLSIPEIVTAQPLIQTQLSLALLAWTAWFMRSDRSTWSEGHIVLLILITIIYYFFLPFGYQNNHLHLEGTGRLSASLLASTCLSTALIFSRSVLKKESSADDAFRYVFFVGSIIVFIALINPAAVLIPSCFFSLPLLLYLLCSAREDILFKATALIGLVPPLVQLVLADPYYFDMLSAAPSTANPPAGATSSGNRALELVLDSFRALFSDPLDVLGTFINLDLLSAQATWQTFIVVGVSYALTSAWVRFREKRFDPSDYLLLAFVGCWWLSYSLLFAPLARSLGDAPPAGLLSPYLHQSLQQNMFMLLIFLIAVVLSRLWTYGGWWVSCLTVFALLKPMISLSTSSAMVSVGPRYAYSGSMGDLTTDDRKVIEFIEDFSRRILAKYPTANSRSIPKILIPNDTLVLGQERWLFSFGGARVLPFRESLPVAFYYSQGNSRQFSWTAYKKNVCLRLNKPWMADKNVRFVFIPSQIAGECAGALRNSIHKEEILFQSGAALFAKLL